jgi:hypothetical protein
VTPGRGIGPGANRADGQNSDLVAETNHTVAARDAVALAAVVVAITNRLADTRRQLTDTRQRLKRIEDLMRLKP